MRIQSRISPYLGVVMILKVNNSIQIISDM